MTTNALNEAPVRHPLFLEYEVSTIARRTGYGEQYLVKLKYGSKPLPPLFRKKVAKALRKPESELFLNQDRLGGAARERKGG